MKRSPLRHLPTWLLLIGYPLFWLEMALKPGAHTSWTAPILFLFCAIWHFWSLKDRFIFRFPRLPTWAIAWILPCLIILGISFLAALLPLHLGQEGDALNYHYALPRQHLIIGSFKHLPWSAADLWPLPIQFALAPYWFATPLPNKFPQFIFLIGLLALVWSLIRRQTSEQLPACAAIAALVGSHGLAIQFGTAMLDIPITYLALATIDSLLEGNSILAGIELAFFCWSKSFMPIQIAVLTIIGWLLFQLTQKSLSWTLGFKEHTKIILVTIKPVIWPFLLASLIVAGPFVAKSLYYVGTPLFPFGSFLLGGTLSKTDALHSAVQVAANSMLKIRNQYGYGRHFYDLFAHVWRVAVPSHGVNNAFDYPLGLPFLLLSLPFLFLLVRSIKERTMPILPLLAFCFWGLWWMGSQQSRWLYTPLSLMAITTLSEPLFARSRMMAFSLLIALSLSCLSLIHAYSPDLKRFPNIQLREKDSDLLKRSREWQGTTAMPVKDKEVTYAEVAVVVKEDAPSWIFATI